MSGAKGYVYEPYLTAVGLPSTFLPVYASGYNLAESHAAANLYTGWMGVVVGDPKMAPYVSTLHDVNVVAVRSVGHVNLGEETTIEVMVENLGMAASNGTLEVRGAWEYAAESNDVNASRGQRSRKSSDGQRRPSSLHQRLPRPARTLREQHAGAEFWKQHAINFGHRQCAAGGRGRLSASSLSRGGYTICTVVATDDAE